MLKKVMKKAKGIRLVITDVDGVLTDGGMYYTANGDTMKKFHTRDGMGVTLLRKNKIPTVIVTKERNKIIKQWSNQMKIYKLYDGVKEKEKILPKVCKIFNIKPEAICFIGDDVNDLELLKRVGFSATPQDAIKKAKDICDYICKNKGGQAAFREIVDLILLSKNIKCSFDL